MSICRIEDGVSDLNIYETDDKFISIIARTSVTNPEYSIPEGMTDLQEMEYTIKHYNKLYMPWDNVYAGFRAEELQPREAIHILIAMSERGVMVPPNVISELEAMANNQSL